ncbi:MULTISPECIES: hypothetical protein [Rhodopseudomonas]|uniref:hypothetical protein n=1 Tax=Rhodopseudomonas TaxID=1073 RepID=UPI00128C9CC8|nr:MULTISPECIES: hypothetical protein [Rhodopseudomonas]MDF3809341.1 hypothetical protein [Rhodopseudomonas sp. BAL398]WOK20875.1 hypothetical protein RBJ75_23075 [Rhodopseudomonas sp. BAL398]
MPESPALFLTATAAIGWLIAYVLNGWRQDRTKRLQIELDHSSAQMKDFYAPLVALTDQLNTTADINDTMVAGKSPDESGVVSGLVYDQFFLPIHEEINAILKSNVHLLEGRVMPESFAAYFRHYTAEEVYRSLTARGQDVSNVRVPGYPPEFYHDVRKGYMDVIARYEDSLQELRERRWFFRFGGLNLFDKAGSRKAS